MLMEWLDGGGEEVRLSLWRSALKESLGLEKKTTVSKAFAESSNFGENKTEI